MEKIKLFVLVCLGVSLLITAFPTYSFAITECSSITIDTSSQTNVISISGVGFDVSKEWVLGNLNAANLIEEWAIFKPDPSGNINANIASDGHVSGMNGTTVVDDNYIHIKNVYLSSQSDFNSRYAIAESPGLTNRICEGDIFVIGFQEAHTCTQNSPDPNIQLPNFYNFGQTVTFSGNITNFPNVQLAAFLKPLGTGVNNNYSCWQDTDSNGNFSIPLEIKSGPRQKYEAVVYKEQPTAPGNCQQQGPVLCRWEIWVGTNSASLQDIHINYTNICDFIPSADPNHAKCVTCASQENQGVFTPFGCIEAKPQALVEKLLKIAIGIAGGIAFLMIIYGGFVIMTSAGNPEHLNSGKEIITSAVVGVLLIVFSVLILKIIGVDILGIPGFGG